MTRPAKYKTPAEMQAKIDQYFEDCQEGKEIKWISKRGEAVSGKVTQPPSWTGLAIFLGFTCRQALNRYIERKKNPDVDDLDLPTESELNQSFVHVLTRAKSRIEQTKLEGASTGLWDWRAIQCDLASNHGYAANNKVQVEGSLDIKIVDEFKDMGDKK